MTEIKDVGNNMSAGLPAKNAFEKTSETQARGLLEHISFYRSIISEDNSGDDYERYYDIAKNVSAKTGKYDKIVGAVFELVIEEQMDPWKIDLKEFVKSYARYMKKNGVDILIAGKIIFMAWKILAMQTREKIESMQEQLASEEEPAWVPEEQWFTEVSPDDVQLTEMILKCGKKLDIETYPRKNYLRPVTAVDVIKAFEQARKTMRKIPVSTESIDISVFMKKLPDMDFTEDVRNLLMRINAYTREIVPFREVDGEDIEDNVSTMISSLFLARDGKIKVWQKQFPYGPIYFRKVVN